MKKPNKKLIIPTFYIEPSDEPNFKWQLVCKETGYLINANTKRQLNAMKKSGNWEWTMDSEAWSYDPEKDLCWEDFDLSIFPD